MPGFKEKLRLEIKAGEQFWFFDITSGFYAQSANI